MDAIDVAEGWTPSDRAAAQVERLVLDDLDLLSELTHPIRGVILRRLKEPRTVAELAQVMDVPVTRLYHHVNRLHDLELIQIVATRQVAAVTERCYQVVAKAFSIDPELFDTLDLRELSLALGSLFDVAKLGLQREVEAGGFRGIDDPEHHSTLSLSEVHLSPERRNELMDRLSTVVSEFVSDRSDDDPDAVPVTLFVAAYADTSRRPD